MFDPVVPNRVWVAAGMGVFHADVPPGTGRSTGSARLAGSRNSSPTT
ncbi:hypothetical protein QP150_12965 [Sphingomonas sp. 22L2VL55-3]